MGNDGLGKEAEKKIREWLDKPEDGYSFDRIPDQMTGFYGSKNICDFTCFKSPFMYYIESKSTYNSRFDFSMIQQHQFDCLMKKSKIVGCYAFVIVLFASHKRTFVLDINTIQDIMNSGKKSINIDRIDKWEFPFCEISTIPNNRKKHLDYTGEIEEYIPVKRWLV